MEKSNQTETGLTGSQMDVARLARWLWKQAGSPPGGYREFWLKVANSKAATLDIEEIGLGTHPGSSQEAEQSPSRPG